ncbi:unnamed protein product, partial [Nesidiocoris tenuis]
PIILIRILIIHSTPKILAIFRIFRLIFDNFLCNFIAEEHEIRLQKRSTGKPYIFRGPESKSNLRSNQSRPNIRDIDDFILIQKIVI